MVYSKVLYGMSYHQMSLLGISNFYLGDLIKFGYVNRDRCHVANGDMRGEMPEWHPYQVVHIEIERVFRIKDHIFCVFVSFANACSVRFTDPHYLCAFVPPFISSYQTSILTCFHVPCIKTYLFFPFVIFVIILSHMGLPHEIYLK